MHRHAAIKATTLVAFLETEICEEALLNGSRCQAGIDN